jgi:hypothetical protein
MILTGEKYEKFIEQVKLGRDIIVGGDLSDITKYIKNSNYTIYLDGDYSKRIDITEDNVRMSLANYLDRNINTLKEGGNMSLKFYPENNFYLTIKCSAREKSINVKWQRWRNDEPHFNQTFEIII